MRKIVYPSIVQREISLVLSWHRKLHARFPREWLTPKQKQENAKHALLAFNVMIAQGLKPDVECYTNLIHIMGQGGHEWQAYKLFARMLEQGLEPLPSTYKELRNATNPRRRSLIRDIENKMKQSEKELPAKLEQELRGEDNLQRAQLAAEFKKIASGEYLKVNSQEESDEGERREAIKAVEKVEKSERVKQQGTLESIPLPQHKPPNLGPYSTVSIQNPFLTWETFRIAQRQKNEPKLFATTLEKEHARSILETLHNEEIRILLTIHRQLRHGSRSQLISRVLSTLSYRAITSIEDRRRKFFSFLRKGIADALNCRQHPEAQETNDTNLPREGVNEQRWVCEDALPQKKELNAKITRDETNPRNASINDEGIQNVLFTPWGFIKEPILKPFPPSSPMNPKRSNPLTPEEHQQILDNVRSDTLDLVPLPLLRKYARHYGIKWKRDFRVEIHKNVEFHAKYLAPGKKDSSTTASIRNTENQKGNATTGQDTNFKDGIGEQKIIHNPFEMMKALTRFATVVQVVDNRTTTSQIKSLYHRVQRERRNDLLARNQWDMLPEKKKIPLLTEWQLRCTRVEPLRLREGLAPNPSHSPHEAKKDSNRNEFPSSVLGVDTFRASRRKSEFSHFKKKFTYATPQTKKEWTFHASDPSVPWETETMENDSQGRRWRLGHNSCPISQTQRYEGKSFPSHTQFSKSEHEKNTQGIRSEEVEPDVFYIDADAEIRARTGEYKEIYFNRFRQMKGHSQRNATTHSSLDDLRHQLKTLNERKKTLMSGQERKNRLSLRNALFIQEKREAARNKKKSQTPKIIKPPQKMALRL